MWHKAGGSSVINPNNIYYTPQVDRTRIFAQEVGNLLQYLRPFFDVDGHTLLVNEGVDLGVRVNTHQSISLNKKVKEGLRLIPNAIPYGSEHSS